MLRLHRHFTMQRPLLHLLIYEPKIARFAAPIYGSWRRPPESPMLGSAMQCNRGEISIRVHNCKIAEIGIPGASAGNFWNLSDAASVESNRS